MKDYIIKHKDIPVATMAIDEYYNIVGIYPIRDAEMKKHLPPGADDPEKLRQWLMDRKIPATRHGWKNIHNEKDSFKFMIDNLGLSLSDAYWLHDIDLALTWKQVNLFENDFSAKHDLDLTDEYFNSSANKKRSFSPSASINGDLEKKWVIDSSGKRMLIKGNNGISCIQSIAEAFATKMHYLQGYQNNYVQYALIDIEKEKSSTKGCICEDMCSENVELISAHSIITSLDPNKCRTLEDSYEAFIQEVTSHRIPEHEVRDFLEYQILTDFAITNVDRHFNNFGVLRNADTLEYIRMAPIYDSGNSLFYNMANIPTGDDLKHIKVNSFAKTEMDLLKLVKNMSIVISITNLPPIITLKRYLQIDHTLREDRINAICVAYGQKLEMLKDMQRGITIWDENYKVPSQFIESDQTEIER